MPITLGSNITSLRGQTGLNKVTNELRSVYERLSSGQRINKASDDAAGLAVSESLKADTRIYSQAIRNVNDGVSLLNIADSALENLSTVVIRLQELSEQAANGVYGSRQRQALDAEAQALAKEFTRIQQTTSFNGISLLNGDLQSLQIQAGIGLSAILDLGVGGAIGNGAFGELHGSSSEAFAQDAETNLMDLNGDGILDLISLNAGTSIDVRVGNGDGTFGNATSYATPNAVQLTLGDFNGDGIVDIVTANSNSSYGVLLGRSDGTFGNITNTLLGSNVREFAVGDINGDGRLDLVGTSTSNNLHVLLGNGNGTFQQGPSVNAGGITNAIVLADITGDGQLDIAVERGLNLQIYSGYGNGTFSGLTQSLALGGGGFFTDLLATDLNNDSRTDLVFAGSDPNVSVFMNAANGSLNSGTSYSLASEAYQIAVGDFNGDGYQDIAAGHDTAGFSILLNQENSTFESGTIYSNTTDNAYGLASGDINQDGVTDIISAGASSLNYFLGTTTEGIAPILQFSLKTMADAKQALSMLKNKSTLLNKQRGEIGAYQARLEITNNVLASATENFTAAASRIKDADIAEESSKLIRNNILQQAASSVLAQANNQPQLVLKLLS